MSATVEDIMKRTALLPLALEEIEHGVILVTSANPAPWKVTRSDQDAWGTDWQIADMGMMEDADGHSVHFYVNTDGCNASRFCGTAEDDANLVAWFRNNALPLLKTAIAAHRLAAGGAE